MRYLKMMNSDWRYSEDRLKNREKCLSILLNKYGSARIEEQDYLTKDIYECIDTWVSQGNKTSSGIVAYFEKYFKGDTNGIE